MINLITKVQVKPDSLSNCIIKDQSKQDSWTVNLISKDQDKQVKFSKRIYRRSKS